MSNVLAAKVKAVNKANEHAHKLYKELVPIFEPLVGQMILKADGKLLKRIVTLVPKYPWKDDLTIHLSLSGYSLAWSAKACEQIQGNSSCLYHESTAYIGFIENGVLKEIAKPFVGRTDYTVEEIEEKRKVYEVAKKAADDAQSALHNFGEYDRA